MPGEIKRVIERIIALRSRGDDLLVHTTTAKLIFKGVDPSRYTSESPDDPEILKKVKQIARDLGVKL